MIAAFILLVLLHAVIDWYQIRQGWHIQHGWETAAYFAVGIIITFVFSWPFIWAAVLSVTTRAALFDISLNLLRGKKWHYNGAGASIVDRIENSLNIPHKVLKVLWIMVYIGSIILYYA